VLMMIPAMALVAANLITGGAGYFRGRHNARWKQVRRDPEKLNDEDPSA